LESSQLVVIEEIRQKWRQDPFLRLLAHYCSLTERQLEALLIEASEETGELKFSEKARLMGITKGSYARILSQALRNISQSLFTIILLSYVGLLNDDRQRWFIELGEAVREGRIDDAILLLEEMQSRLRKLSK
jgi:predicted DNA-binding protein (UPF0251 family)